MLKHVVDRLIFDKAGLVPKTHVGEAVDFFVYDWFYAAGHIWYTQ